MFMEKRNHGYFIVSALVKQNLLSLRVMHSDLINRAVGIQVEETATVPPLNQRPTRSTSLTLMSSLLRS